MDDEIFDDLHVGVVALREAAGANPLSEKAFETLARLEKEVPTLRESFANVRRRLKDDALKVAQKTDETVREHPWVFTLTALGLGILTGITISGREKED